MARRTKSVQCGPDGWPLEMPNPDPEQFCTGKLAEQGQHECCLLGWLNKSFTGDALSWADESFGKSWKAMLRFERTLCKLTGPSESIGLWNDGHTQEECRAVWQKALKHHGYTEDVQE